MFNSSKIILLAFLSLTLAFTTGCDDSASPSPNAQSSRADDADADSVLDVDDNCPFLFNPDQEDVDKNGIGDICDPEFSRSRRNTDKDDDGIPNERDNCPKVANADQSDRENNGVGDGVGDACDNCPDHINADQKDRDDSTPEGDACEASLLDPDGDGILTEEGDNCFDVFNPDQADSNEDGIGDACDDSGDNDNDGVLNSVDNCIDIPNGDYLQDGDKIYLEDEQGNLIPNEQRQLDSDGDGVGDACDNCAAIANGPKLLLGADGVLLSKAEGDDIALTLTQLDNDNDGSGDLCDDDDDNDGVADDQDNCPLIANANQLNLDADLELEAILQGGETPLKGVNELGNVCDPDADGDGYFAAAKANFLSADQRELFDEAKVDCNDLNANVHPDRDGDPFDFQDSDCDGDLSDELELSLARDPFGDDDEKIWSGTRRKGHLGETGSVVASAGDIDGDDLDDYMVASPKRSSVGRSGDQVVLYYGDRKLGQKRSDGVNIVEKYTVIQAETDGTLFGKAMASGDFNGDGCSDIVIGAPGFNDNKGKVYLAFGKCPDRFGNNNVMGVVAAVNSNGFSITGQDVGSEFGVSLSMGDVNGDGCDDLLIGAGADDTEIRDGGAAYLVLGRGSASCPTDEDEFKSIANGTRTINQFKNVEFIGLEKYGYAASKVAVVKSIDGGSFDEIAIGVPYGKNHAGVKSGKVYLIYGKSTEDLLAQKTVLLNSGTQGVYALMGSQQGERVGFALASAGDVDGSRGDVDSEFANKNDFLIGAPGYNNKRGRFFLVSGSSEQFNHQSESVIHLDVNSQVARFEGEKEGSRLGHSLSAGDLNGDGFSDIVAGANNYTYVDEEGGRAETNSGKVYVVLGKLEGFSGINTIHHRGVAVAGFIGEDGQDRAGESVAVIGNINGDYSTSHDLPIKDIVIGAPGFDRVEDNGTITENAGRSYVIFGVQ